MVVTSLTKLGRKLSKLIKMEKLLELRKKLKKKKPDFLRQDGHKIKRLKKKWRAPKGIHSKMRRKLGSYRKQPSVGYSSPKKVRFLHPSGLKEILTHNFKDLEKINSKTEAVVIAKNVGTRKKIELLKKIKELNITILNIKNPEEFIAKVDQKLEKKKQVATKREEKKKKSKEKSLEKAKQKEEKEKKKTEEEKKKEEDKEKKDVLSKETKKMAAMPKETKKIQKLIRRKVPGE